MKIKLPWTEMEFWWEDYNALTKFVNFIIPWIIDNIWIKQDESKFKRWENAQKIFIKAKLITDEINQKLKEPPLKISIPLLESASLEENNELQEKWANLLVNSLIEKKDIKSIYIDILKNLSSLEVKILDRIYEKSTSKEFIQIRIETILDDFQISKNDCREIIYNFFRLWIAETNRNPYWKPTNADFFEITILWIRFIEACKI